MQPDVAIWVRAGSELRRCRCLPMPFVGRILIGTKPSFLSRTSGANDPGVESVANHDHHKACGYETVVMGASFRNTDEIIRLAGCDRLTIGPGLLAGAGEHTRQSRARLESPSVTPQTAPGELQAAEFRWQHNENAMAVEKLSEGIRAFAADQSNLKNSFRTWPEQTVTVMSRSGPEIGPDCQY